MVWTYFLDCVFDDYNKTFEILFIKQVWFDSTHMKYNIHKGILVIRNEDVKLITGFKGQYVEMIARFNLFNL